MQHHQKKILTKLIRINRISILFLFITVLGFILRLYFIFSNDIFTDEVFYTQIARQTSFINLLTHNFWIKDHGILYPLFLKLAQCLTTNIVLLRTTNLLIFLIISFALFNFFQKISKSVNSLIPIFLFSFLPYFIYINSSVTIYNFVMLFSILAFIYVSNLILFSTTREEKLRNPILFLIFSTLAFYSDYSVVYFYLPLITLLFLVLNWRNKEAENLTLLGFLNLILISPGIFQLMGTFNKFYALNGISSIANLNIISFFDKFANVILFKSQFYISEILLLMLVLSLLFLVLRSKKITIQYLAYFGLTGFVIDFIFLYIFNSIYFQIFLERTFWFFNFLLILGIYSISGFLSNFKKLAFIILMMVIVFIKVYIITYQPPIIMNPYIDYKDFVTKLVSEMNGKNSTIILVDRKGTDFGVPLTNYYFQGLSLSQKERTININLYSKLSLLYNVKSSTEAEFVLPEAGNVIFIIFEFDDNRYYAFRNAITNFIGNNGLRLNTVYFRLECKQSNYCYFNREL